MVTARGQTPDTAWPVSDHAARSAGGAWPCSGCCSPGQTQHWPVWLTVRALAIVTSDGWGALSWEPGPATEQWSKESYWGILLQLENNRGIILAGMTMERRKAPGDQITEVIPGNGDTDTFCLSSSILFIINLRSCCVFCVIIAGLIQLLSVFLSSPSLLMKVVVCGEEEKNKVPETRADKKGLLNCQLRVGPFTRGRSLVDTETGILGEAAQSAPCYASAASWPHHNLHPDPETAGEGLMYRVMPHILTWSPLLYPA